LKRVIPVLKLCQASVATVVGYSLGVGYKFRSHSDQQVGAPHGRKNQGS